MRTLTTIYSFVLSLILVLTFSVSDLLSQNGTANLQVIHNSPDPAVSSVDIFVNGDEFATGFNFREATAFDEVPAGVELSIEIAPAGAGIENAVGPFTFTLDEGVNYTLVASGVVDESAFTGAEGFSLEAYAPSLTEADDPTTVAVNIMHGSPDAPAVDIYLEQTGATAAVGGLAFPDFTGYLPLAPNNEVVGIAGAGGDVLVEFSAPFADLNLEGAALTVLASGFFDGDNAGEGNAFGLLAVLPDGTTLMLDVVEAEEFANVQIIHNSADPAAESVDIFVNGELTLPGVEFRQATSFLELPGDTPLDIVVSPADAGIESGVEFAGVEFTTGANYYVVASGVLDPSKFAENPDEINTGFFLDVIPNANLSADAGNFDFLIYHGSTDAPAVDIVARDVAQLAAGVSYTGFTPDYISVPASEYIIDIFPAGSDDVLISFDADVSPLDGATGIVLASGFLDPTANNDGPGFGLILVLVDGSVVELGVATSSEVISGVNPDRFELNQNYPNPFNPSTNISYSLPQASDVKIEIFNITGQRVATLVDSQQSAGQYTISFDASTLASGVYLCRIQADNFTQTRRMTLIK